MPAKADVLAAAPVTVLAKATESVSVNNTTARRHVLCAALAPTSTTHAMDTVYAMTLAPGMASASASPGMPAPTASRYVLVAWAIPAAPTAFAVQMQLARASHPRRPDSSPAKTAPRAHRRGLGPRATYSVKPDPTDCRAVGEEPATQ